MKKIIIAVVIVLGLVGAWLYDQGQTTTTAPAAQQLAPQPRGADDMRNLRIP